MAGNVHIDQYVISIASRSIYKVQCRDDISWYCYTAQLGLYNVCLFFRYHYNTRTLLLSDIMTADYLAYKQRFFVSYNLYSILYSVRFLLSMHVRECDPVVSLTKLFSCASWFEREIYDLFGIKFTGHSDMRRILTDYGFVWHPLKKDFPLTGFVEVHYDALYKCVLSNKVNSVQEYRVWYFSNQWT